MYINGKCSLSSLVSHSLLQYGAVPLGIAAEKGNPETVQRLLEAGANVNHQDKVMTHNCYLLFPNFQSTCDHILHF